MSELHDWGNERTWRVNPYELDTPNQRQGVQSQSKQGEGREEFRVAWFCRDGRAGTTPFQKFSDALRDAERLNALDPFDAHVERREVTSWQVCGLGEGRAERDRANKTLVEILEVAGRTIEAGREAYLEGTPELFEAFENALAEWDAIS